MGLAGPGSWVSPQLCFKCITDAHIGSNLSTSQAVTYLTTQEVSMCANLTAFVAAKKTTFNCTIVPLLPLKHVWLCDHHWPRFIGHLKRQVFTFEVVVTAFIVV